MPAMLGQGGVAPSRATQKPVDRAVGAVRTVVAHDQPADDADGHRWVPATVFGAALGPATDAEAAESLVRERGLSSLAGQGEWVRGDQAEIQLAGPST
jgi:hypothetical protein